MRTKDVYEHKESKALFIVLDWGTEHTWLGVKLSTYGCFKVKHADLAINYIARPDLEFQSVAGNPIFQPRQK